MKIVKGLVVNSISGSNRFIHDHVPLIAVTGAVVFGKHPNQHQMPSDEVFFHVAGMPGEIASIGGDFTVTGSTNLLDDVFVPQSTLHIGESSEQLRVFVNDATASIESNVFLALQGNEVQVDSIDGKIKFQKDDQDYVFFEMSSGQNDIRIEAENNLLLRGDEIINDSIDGIIKFQESGEDRLLMELGEQGIILQTDDKILLKINEIEIGVDETGELSVLIESTFEEKVTFKKNLLIAGGLDISGSAIVINDNGFTSNVQSFFNDDVVIDGNLTVNGETTVLQSQNLVIEDPFILLAKSSNSFNTNGGLVILSGATDDPNFFGSNDLALGRVDSDTWGVVRIDSLNGTLEDLETGHLVNFRAQEIQVGNDGARVYYEDSSNELVISNEFGNTIVQGDEIINDSIDGLVRFQEDGEDRLLMELGEQGLVIEAVGDLTLRGNEVQVDSINGVIRFQEDGDERLLMELGGQDLAIEVDGNLTLRGNEIINDSINGIIRFQEDGNNQLLIDLNSDLNESTILSNGSLVLTGSNLSMDSASGIFVFAQNGIDFLTFDASTNSILPGTDKTINLGSNTRRFANVYTGDLHLRNERGHWQIVEEADCLTIYNCLTNVRYKFVLEKYEI